MTAIIPPTCIRCGHKKPKVMIVINDGKNHKVPKCTPTVWNFNIMVYFCLQCYKAFEKWLGRKLPTTKPKEAV